MSDNSPLSKSDLMWAEMVDLAHRIELIYKQVKESEDLVGKTATSIDESIKSLLEDIKDVANTADDLIGSKKEELQKQIDLLIAEAGDKAATRDLEVVELISENVENNLKGSIGQFTQVLTDNSNLIIKQLQQEVSRGIVNAANTVKKSSQSNYYMFFSLAIILLITFGTICSYSGYYVAYAHYRTSTSIAESLISTENGDAAVHLAELNDMKKMLNCDGYKVTKKNGYTYCVPVDNQNTVAGWRIK